MLSENWTFQPEIRRWSRVGDMGIPGGSIILANAMAMSNYDKSSAPSRESSSERYVYRLLMLIGCVKY